MAETKHESLATRLYSGDVSVDFIGLRRRWYLASGIVILISVLSLAIRGLTPSIDFKGGEQYTFAAQGHTISQVQQAVSGLGFSSQDTSIVYAGRGNSRTIQVQTPTQQGGGLSTEETTKVEKTIADGLGIPMKTISVSGFSGTWGSQITQKAILGLVVFLVFVSIYLSIRFEWKMAAAAMIALIHDLIVTAGVYSLVGFEVSPSTVIALLTILGYSLYDTVVVFDKVRENIHGLDRSSSMTFSEATNLAVNQTLVRSINTSIIALLPVIGLLVIGAGLLGAGSLDDLALALLVGLASGAYSSIFIASPLVAEFKEREPAYQQLAKRVATRRGREAKAVAVPAVTGITAPAAGGATPDAASPVPRGPRPQRPGTPPRRRHGGGGRPSRKRR